MVYESKNLRAYQIFKHIELGGIGDGLGYVPDISNEHATRKGCGLPCHGRSRIGM